MKKDIEFPAVEGVKVIISLSEPVADNDMPWQVFILNDNNFTIENVIVVSRGYGEKDNEPQRTSTLRQLIGSIAPNTAAMVETIDPAVFHLFNEFWVSYYIDDTIYDKKFIFVPGSIAESNLSYIPQLDMKGILHE